MVESQAMPRRLIGLIYCTDNKKKFCWGNLFKYSPFYSLLEISWFLKNLQNYGYSPFEMAKNQYFTGEEKLVFVFVFFLNRVSTVRFQSDGEKLVMPYSQETPVFCQLE